MSFYRKLFRRQPNFVIVQRARTFTILKKSLLPLESNLRTTKDTWISNVRKNSQNPPSHRLRSTIGKTTPKNKKTKSSQQKNQDALARTARLFNINLPLNIQGANTGFFKEEVACSAPCPKISGPKSGPPRTFHPRRIFLTQKFQADYIQ